MANTFMGNQSGSMGIDRFISQIRDLVRPNLFLVELSNYGGGIKQAPENFKFHCKASSGIPESRVEKIDVAFMGRSIPVAGTRGAFADWDVTVYNDIDYKMRGFFEEWVAGINKHEQNTGFNRIRDYYADANVMQLDQKGKVIANYTFKGIFPTSVDAIGLDWTGGSGGVEEFRVGFAVCYWDNSAADVA